MNDVERWLADAAGLRENASKSLDKAAQILLAKSQELEALEVEFNRAAAAIGAPLLYLSAVKGRAK